jgi:hypothetical protein
VIAGRLVQGVTRWVRVSQTVFQHRRAVGALIVTEVGLRGLPLPTLSRVLGFRLQYSDATGEVIAVGDSRGDALAAARSIERVARRWPFGDTCLRRAVALGFILRRERPVLRVGVVRTTRGIRGHAWLEIGGKPVDPNHVGEARPFVHPGRS